MGNNYNQEDGCWWTSTEAPENWIDYAWFRGLTWIGNYVMRTGMSKSCFMSIRSIKN
jgi:hypothetical protein